MVVKAEGVGADGLGAFYLCLGGGVAVEFGQFGAVEHIGEPQPEVWAAVGVVDGDGAAANLDGNAEDFVRRGVVVFGASVAEGVALDSEHTEGVALAVAGVALRGEDDAEVVGVGAARDNMEGDKFLVEIFEGWPDIEKRQRYVGRGGDDAARGEELLADNRAGLKVGVSVAVQDGESAGVGSAVGGFGGEPEGGERLPPQHHFGLDDGSEVVECDGAGIWVVGFGENKVFAGAVEDMQRYIHGSSGGLHGDSLDGGGKHDVAEVEVKFCHS